MHKYSALGPCVAISVFASVEAAAQQPGADGTLALGVDRLFGISYSTQTEKGQGLESSTSVTKVSLFGDLDYFSVQHLPRLSVDYFFGPGVSVGGSIMYAWLSAGGETDGQDLREDTSSGVFLLSPRVGYATMFNQNVGVWPRAGITYARTSSTLELEDPRDGGSATNDSSTSRTLLSLEAMLILSPAPHVGLTLGPTFDYELGRSSESNGEDILDGMSTSYNSIGVQAGLLAWF